MAADDSGEWCHRKDCLIQEEIEVLESIYIDELQIERDEKGHPESLCLQLHPATGDDHDKKFVCMTLILQLPEQYPDEVPEVLIRNPRGLSEEELQSLVESMLELAEERRGGHMLYEIIELAKESLTEGNIPHCPCMVCLEHFTEGDNFTRTECYHYFHCHCLARYISHTLQVQKEEEQYRDRHHCKEEDKMPCPVCRENIEYDLDNLVTAQPTEDDNEKIEISETVRQWQKEMSARFAVQKENGGIIDLEAEKNKYLLSAANLSALPRTGSGSNLESLNKKGQVKGVKDDSAKEMLQGGRGENINKQSYRDRWKNRLKSAHSDKTDMQNSSNDRNRDTDSGFYQDNDNHRGDVEEKYHNANHHRDKYRDEVNHRDRYHGNNNQRGRPNYNRYDNQRYRNGNLDRERSHCKADTDKSTKLSEKDEEEDKCETSERANPNLKDDIIENKKHEYEGASEPYIQDRRPRYNEKYRGGRGRQNLSRRRGGFSDRSSGSGFSRDHQNTGSRNQERDWHGSVSGNKSKSLRNSENEKLHTLKEDSKNSVKDSDSNDNVDVTEGDKLCSTGTDKRQDACEYDPENSTGDVKRESNKTKERKYDGRKYNDWNDKRVDSRNYVDGKPDRFGQNRNIRRNYEDWDRDYYHGNRRGSGRGSRRSGSDTQRKDYSVKVRNTSPVSNDKAGNHHDSEERWQRNKPQNIRSESDLPIDEVHDASGLDSEHSSSIGDVKGESNKTRESKSDRKKYNDFNDERVDSGNHVDGKPDRYGYNRNMQRNYEDWDRDHYHGNRKGSGRGSRRSGSDIQKNNCSEKVRNVRSERDVLIEDANGTKENYKEEDISQDGQNGVESQNRWHEKGKVNRYINDEKGNWKGHGSEYSRHKHSEDFGSRKGKGFGRPASGKQKVHSEHVGQKNSYSSQRWKENGHEDNQEMQALGVVEDKRTQPNRQAERYVSTSCDNETCGDGKTLPQQKRPPPGFEHVTVASNGQSKIVKPPPGFS